MSPKTTPSAATELAIPAVVALRRLDIPGLYAEARSGTARPLRNPPPGGKIVFGMAIDVERLGPEAKLELYVKPGCPYCAQAEAFYNSRGLKFASYNAQDDPAMKRRMLALASGDPTVPAIVVNGAYVQSGWGKPPRG